MAFQFREDESAAEGARRIALEQLGRAIGRLQGAPGDDRDAAVHEARKRIKKARAILRVVRGSAGRRGAGKLDRRLRDAARPLSGARDASALVSALDALADRSEGLAPPGTFDRARRSLVARRDEVARRMLDEGDPLASAAEALRSARRRIGRRAPDGDGDLASGLKRAYKRARAAFGAASASPDPETLHDWRKRVKALAYPLRALGADPAGPAARLLRLARLLAEELGDAHDLDVLRESLGAEAPDAVLALVDRRRADLRRAALLRGATLFADRTRDFLRSLGRSPRPAGASRHD